MGGVDTSSACLYAAEICGREASLHPHTTLHALRRRSRGSGLLRGRNSASSTRARRACGLKRGIDPAPVAGAAGMDPTDVSTGLLGSRVWGVFRVHGLVLSAASVWGWNALGPCNHNSAHAHAHAHLCACKAPASRFCPRTHRPMGVCQWPRKHCAHAPPPARNTPGCEFGWPHSALLVAHSAYALLRALVRVTCLSPTCTMHVHPYCASACTLTELWRLCDGTCGTPACHMC